MSAVFEVGGVIPTGPSGFVFGLPGGSAGTVATPTFSPPGGTYSSTQTASISCSTPASTIYYTTDGSTPTYPITGTTQQYTTTLTVSSTETVQAIGAASGYLNSSVASATYTIGTLSFDYFISPNGDDNNNGLTPATAWSLSGLTNNQSTYGNMGKKIGIIGDISGTQTSIQYGTKGGVQTTIYSWLNANTNACFAQCDGGTSSHPTYIASCTSSGVYQRGWAVIDASQPGTGTHATQGLVMGQNGNSTPQVPHPDNITYDGLTFANFAFCAIAEESAASTFTNIVIQNCEFYGSNTSGTSSNPGCIRLQDTNGAQITNCKFHDCQSVGGAFSPWGLPGVFTYSSNAVTITNCSFYNMVSVQQKDTNQDAIISYSYLDMGDFGAYSGGGYYAYYEGVTAAGHSTTIHHCIFLGGIVLLGGNIGGYSGNYNIYNNTFYPTSSSSPCFDFNDPLAGSTVHFYNNVLYQQGGGAWGGSYGTGKFVGANGTLAPTWNHNYYLTSPTFNTGSGISYASWQGLGFDANSFTGGTPFAATPSALNMSSFTVSGSSPANSGGVGGAIMGALDGSGSIGCNF